MTFTLNHPRIRDVYVLLKGDTFPVAVSPAMRAAGWRGGQGLCWDDAPTDDFRVTFSDGRFGGFALNGSNESSDTYTALTGSQVAYGSVVMCMGNWIISTRTFEQYTYASQQVGPLVPLTYVVGDRLVFSLAGLWTVEDTWTLSGDPRAPNNLFSASVIQTPSSANSNYLTLQVSV